MFIDEKEQTVNEEQTKPKIKLEDLGIEIDENILKDDEGTPENEAPEDTGKPSPEKGELPDEFLQRYKGKSNDELLTTLYESQKFIGKQSHQLGEQKKSGTNELEEINDEISSTESSIKKLNKKLEDFDADYDKEDEEYVKLSDGIKKKEEKLKKLRDRQQEANIQTKVQKAMYEQHNRQFLTDQRNVVAEKLGLPNMDEVIWDAISESAQRIAGIGEQVTAEDVQAATVKVIGADNYATYLNVNAKARVRQDMANAAGKTVSNLTGTGKSSVKTSELSDEKLEKALEHLWHNDRPGYEKLAEAIKNQRRT